MAESVDNRRKLRSREIGPALELLFKSAVDNGQIHVGVIADEHGYRIAECGDADQAAVLGDYAAMWLDSGPKGEAAKSAIADERTVDVSMLRVDEMTFEGETLYLATIGNGSPLSDEDATALSRGIGRIMSE